MATIKSRNTLIAELMTAVLLVYFVHNAIDNFVRIQSLQNLLGFYTSWRWEVAWGIWAVNVVIAILLFIPRLRKTGLYATIAYAVGFWITGYFTPRFPHSFGGLLNLAKGTDFLWLTALLGVLALITLALYSRWLLPRSSVKAVHTV